MQLNKLIATAEIKGNFPVRSICPIPLVEYSIILHIALFVLISGLSDKGKVPVTMSLGELSSIDPEADVYCDYNFLMLQEIICE